MAAVFRCACVPRALAKAQASEMMTRWLHSLPLVCAVTRFMFNPDLSSATGYGVRRHTWVWHVCVVFLLYLYETPLGFPITWSQAPLGPTPLASPTPLL